MTRSIVLTNELDHIVYAIDLDKLCDFLDNNNIHNNLKSNKLLRECNEHNIKACCYNSKDALELAISDLFFTVRYSYSISKELMEQLLEECYIKPHTHKEVAHKFDNDKSRIDLIPPKALKEIGDVFNYGAKKYESYNWALGKGLEWHRLYAAIQRHLNSFWDGEDIDESGFTHLSHAACSLLMLMDLYYHNHGIDDRYKYEVNDDKEDNNFPDINFLATIESNKQYNLFERVMEDYKYSNILVVLTEVFGFPSYNKFRVKNITIQDVYNVDRYNIKSKEYILPETIYGTYSFEYVVDDITIIVNIDNRYNLSFEYKTNRALEDLYIKIQYTFAMR